MSIPKMPLPPKLEDSILGSNNPVRHIPHHSNPHNYTPPTRIPSPPTPQIVTHNGELTEGEIVLVLRSTLLPEHREDANVLRFISSYVRCRSARQAAREAGLKPQHGDVLRSRPDIHLCITKLTEKSVMKYGFDASEVVERVKEISNIDPIEFENPDGTFKLHMKDIDPECRRTIKKFKAKNFYEKDPNGMERLAGQIIEVELYDKMKGLEMLGREKDLFKGTTTVQHDVTSRMASVLLESTSRAEAHMKQLKDVTRTEDVEVYEAKVEKDG